jgi:hypothetical protein
MSNLRALAHLEEQLGPERFQVLIHSRNTGKVKRFCDRIIRNFDPTDVVIGNHTFDMSGIIKELLTQTEPSSIVVLLDSRNGRHIMEHQAEIPFLFRGKVRFMFKDYFVDHGAGIFDLVQIWWEGERWGEESSFCRHEEFDSWRGRHDFFLSSKDDT